MSKGIIKYHMSGVGAKAVESLRREVSERPWVVREDLREEGGLDLDLVGDPQYTVLKVLLM